MIILFHFSIHICVTYCHTAEGVAERFISDVTKEVASFLKDPNSKVSDSVSLVGVMTWKVGKTLILMF